MFNQPKCYILRNGDFLYDDYYYNNDDVGDVDDNNNHVYDKTND